MINKVFLSGPMSNYPAYNAVEFGKAYDKFYGDNTIVLNPAILPIGLEHQEYMEICKPMVMIADTLYMLNGWEKSVGASQEHEWAVNNDKRIIYQSGDETREPLHSIGKIEKCGRIY